MRKTAIWLAGGALLLIIFVGAFVFIGGNTSAGRSMIERLTFRLTAGHVRLIGLNGSFPTRLTLGELQLVDDQGVWLSADRIALEWSPLDLLARRIYVDDLRVARLHFERTPVSASPGGQVSIPDITVARFGIDLLELGAPLAGSAASFAARGSTRLRSLQDAFAEVHARRIENEGEYDLQLRLDPTRMDATLDVHEPASGPLENILQLPGLGALSAHLSFKGPRTAEAVDLALDAGELRARFQGTVDLVRQSGDLTYSLQSAALSPRPEVAWQRIALQGRWRGTLTAPVADGHLAVEGLRLAGVTEVAKITADLTAAAGKLGLQGVLEGLRVPGPQPQFLAKDAVKIDASIRLDDASRPLDFTASHRLFALRGHAVTAGAPSATLELRIPDVAPFAIMGHQDVKGDASINARIARRGGDTDLGVDAKVGFAGGTAGWIALLGKRAEVQLAGSFNDTSVHVERLRLAGDATTFFLTGDAARDSGSIRDLQARWDLAISDLSIVAAELKGNLDMSGRLSGSPTSLAGDAELTSALSVRGSPTAGVSASLQVRGIPSQPSGKIQARGTIDESPLDVDIDVERSGGDTVRGVIRRANWKSAHAEGEVSAGADMAQARGQVRVDIGQLSDFDRLLGVQAGGAVQAHAELSPVDGQNHMEFQLNGENLKINALAGNLQLSGAGAPGALALELALQLPQLGGGGGSGGGGGGSGGGGSGGGGGVGGGGGGRAADLTSTASLKSTASLNLGARQLQLSTAAVDFRGQTLRLLAPANISFANGLAVDVLKVGVEGAVLQIEGRVLPALDLRATLRDVGPKLANVFAPDLLAGGALDANASLQGSFASPTGRIGLTANGVRFANDTASDLPPLDLHATAELEDNAADIDARLSAGADSLLTVTGNVPLNVNGAADMKIAGKLDVGLVNPILEARGMHASGALVVAATVAGAASTPQIGGTVELRHGSLRDYVRGVNLTDIAADFVGSEGTLQIKSFAARAASGNLAMTGSIGLLRPKIPIELTITARDAQPVASSIVTANLNADLKVSGTLRERIDIDGKIHLNRTTIGIPDSLPPEVVTLDVRRRGHAAAPVMEKDLVIGLDITVDAPQDIIVQGRGLDARLGGDLHLGGTTDAPLATGSFDLQRGSFSLAGNRLNFTAGRVSFDGPGLKKAIDPTLDFTAETSVQDVTATVRITGLADSLKFEFTSSPPLPQDEIMARLLFGENAAQLTASQAVQIAAALATLTGGGSGLNPLTKLQKSLGLDRLSVGSGTPATTPNGEPTGASIAAGRYISKRVYIEGKRTTTGTSQVQVDVDLTKHLKLQTRLGNGTAITQGTTPENDPGSSVGLSYQFEY